jgi:hypothetical protein
VLRIVLTAIIACGVLFLLSAIPASAANPTDLNAILGEWHLQDLASSDTAPLPHRMDLRFRITGAELKGAILSRNDGSEIPLAVSEFDGATLRFQMTAGPGRSQADMPAMVMTWTGARFEGAWINTVGDLIGPKLKLVRAAARVAHAR